MNDYQERDNSGSAFPVKEKKSHNHADHSGKAMVDGKTYWINVWEKKDRNGNPWFSFSFNERKPHAYGDKPEVEIKRSFAKKGPDDGMPPW
jgi:hypothetical protein